jgi:hypothetical protein
MEKTFLVFAGLNTLALFIINAIPDDSVKTQTFVVFGIVLGLPWMIMGLKGLIGGIASGAAIGALLSVMNSTASDAAVSTVATQSLQTQFIAITASVCVLTAFGSFPFLANSEH